MIDVAQKYWMDKPFSYKKAYEGCRFHHISTDEVYGTLNETDLFTEETPYAPNSPYSASKASSDMIVRSYQETYGMNTVITNCSNNYGPKQHDEKLIPTIIRKALANENIPIYGDGKNIRDWLYVLDHCKGIDLVYHTGKEGNVYNIGGRNERTNLQIVDAICTILDEKVPQKISYKELITFVEDRAGHDRRYAIDATKLENELGWKADENFDTGILKTIDWYLAKYNIIIKPDSIVIKKEYYAKDRSSGSSFLPWMKKFFLTYRKLQRICRYLISTLWTIQRKPLLSSTDVCEKLTLQMPQTYPHSQFREYRYSKSI